VSLSGAGNIDLRRRSAIKQKLIYREIATQLKVVNITALSGASLSNEGWDTIVVAVTPTCS
jgi:hypothetical protein